MYTVGKNLEVRKAPWYYKLYKYSFLLNLIFCILFLYGSFTPVEIVKYVTIEKIVNKIVPEDIKLNDTSLVKELVKNDVMQINVALAQAKLETGYYKSRICRENKNLFGIKAHKCKYVQGSKNNHAYYKTYKDNIACYAHIQRRYLKNIDGKYAEAPDYIDALKRIK
jgi:uncharacterized FlgJ-related protein